MTTKISELRPISCLAGVQPSADSTALSTKHFTFADKIRFNNGMPEKIGGWSLSIIENSDFVYGTIQGVTRSIYSAVIDGFVQTLIGTNEKLYSLRGSRLTNLTPLQATTTTIANSIDTLYGTLANNPITTVINTSTITIADTSAARFQIGDTITLSGATAVGGIGAPTLNTAHVIRSIGVNSYTIMVGATATSSATGGGASVVRATGLLRFTAAAHGMLDGDRVKITGAANTGGILAAAINVEYIIRNVAAGTFDGMTTGTATSSVTAGGGASTAYQKEIADGRADASLGQGYGMGLYGVGLYGVSKSSSGGILFPRIWFFDRFADTIIMTPGNQTGVYEWDGSNIAAPTLITNAPTAVNYAFVSDSILVTFGAGDVGNKIFASDQGDPTIWTASSTNQVFEDNIEGAGTLISHVSVAGLNLIFTEQQTYTFRYIGLPNVWEIKLKDASIGIIAPMARCVVNDIAYWMGNKNFYMWRGGNVEVLPSNSLPQSTILNYVFTNINFAQSSKCFAWNNKQFNEIWFHYPSAGSNNPDRIARLCLNDYSWTPDTLERTAAEYPDILLNNPRLAKLVSGDTEIYKHELGTDDGDLPMAFELSTNLKTAGRNTTTEVGFIPDSNQVGSIDVQIDGYLFPQSTVTTYTNNYTVTPTTERIPSLVNGRFWKYTWSGAVLGQSWFMGSWQEYLQSGGGN